MGLFSFNRRWVVTGSTVAALLKDLAREKLVFCPAVAHCCWSEGFCFTCGREKVTETALSRVVGAIACKLSNVECKCGGSSGTGSGPCQQETGLHKKKGYWLRSSEAINVGKKMVIIFYLHFSPTHAFWFVCALRKGLGVLNRLFTCA